MNPKLFHLPIGATNLLKFVACLMVASSHYFTYRILGLENTQYAIQTVGGIYLIRKTLMSLGGAVGNAVFFVLSGY